MRRVASLVPAVLEGDGADSVHDLRVSIRRLQQGLDAVFPKPRTRALKKARRQLRRLRRALGEWRNLDVARELAEARRQGRDPWRRRAWTLIADELDGERRLEIERARREISRLDPAALERIVRRLIETTRGRRPPGARRSVGAALDAWDVTLAKARTIRTTGDVHGLRLATKRLRYRIELRHELGDAPPDRSLAWLRELQEMLGGWHDRLILRERVARAMAKPGLLLDEPRTVSAALRDLERETKAAAAEIRRAFRHTDDTSVPVALRQWVST